MKIRFAFVRHERVLLFFLYAAIALIFVGPSSSASMHPMIPDYLNHVGIITQAKMALLEGQFPLRVAPFEQDGWRYPLYQFYSPTAYTIAGLAMRWLTRDNPIAAYQMTLWLCLILGGVYMNRLAYWFVKSRPAALLASIVYIASPYYIIVINHFAGFSEAMALAIVPAALYYTVQRFNHPKENKTLLQTALVWYLLATTHIITFFYTSIFGGLLLLLVCFQNSKYWRNLISVGLAYAFACVLAIWYLAPVALFNKYLYITRWYDANSFQHYRVGLASLLSPSENILNLVGNQANNNIQILQANIGIPMLLAVGIFIYVFFTKAKLETRRGDYWLLSLFIVFILSILVAWSPLNIWPLFPHALTVGQYSWRIMSQTIWLGALLFAWAVNWLCENKLNERHILAGLFLILLTANTWLPVQEVEYSEMQPVDFNKNPGMVMSQGMYNFDAERNSQFVNFVSSRLNAKKFLDVNQVRPNCKQEKNAMLCVVTPAPGVDLIALPVFYYPGLLSVSVNGKPSSFSSVLTQKRLAVAIKPLSGTLNIIRVQFTGLAWANSLSAMGWGLWVLFLLFIGARAIFINAGKEKAA